MRNTLSLSQQKELMELSKGDIQFFEPIYRCYFSDVYRYCFSKTFSIAQAQEMTAQAFYKAVDAIQTFTWKNVSVKCWLITIARHEIFKETYHRKKILPLEQIEEMVHPEDDQIKSMIEQESVGRVKEIIEALPQSSQEIIRLKFWSECTFVEIAQILGVSDSKVKMSYYRCLHKIKSEFE